jgi:hypothetical protein
MVGPEGDVLDGLYPALPGEENHSFGGYASGLRRLRLFPEGRWAPNVYPRTGIVGEPRGAGAP